MSRFLTPLVALKIAEAEGFGRAQWKLKLPLVYQSDVLKRCVTVPRGYVSDFSSVPRWPFAYWVAGDTAHASAVVHDYLCADGVTRWPVAADVFGEAMTVEGVPVWRRALMVTSVRLFGCAKGIP